MSSEWKQLTLGDVTTWSSGGTPKKDIDAYWNGDIPWISANSMHGTRFSDSDLKITEAGLKNGSRLAERNSILLLVRGGALHSRIPVGIAMRDVAFNQDVKSLKAKEEFISPWFLLFWLMAHERFLLDSVVEYTGIGAGKLDTKRMQSLPFLVPPHEEMIAIEQIAKSIDERINLLRETNATLEEIAQALFKSWFVDFDPVHANAGAQAPSLSPEIQALFPATFTDSPQGPIPEGWCFGNLGDELKIAYGKNLPTTKLLETGYPVFGGNGQIGFFSDYLYEDRQVLVACRGAASGKVNQSIPKSFVTNNSLVLEFNSKLPFGYLKGFMSFSDLSAHVTGSAQPQVTIDNLKGFKIMVPNAATVNAYESISNSIENKIEENNTQGRALAELRDTLLPRLISGQLRLPEAEQAIAAITD